jgi:amino acid adenylation domain-containing protein
MKLQAAITDIWKKLLGLEAIGENDNFFELGGDSLLAIRFLSILGKETGVKVPLREVFLHPTIGQLCDCLTTAEDIAAVPVTRVPRREPIPLSFGQERLWFIHRLQGSVEYHIPLALRIRGQLDADALADALGALVDRHEILRTVISQGEEAASQRIMNKKCWRLSVIDKQEIDKAGVEQDAYLRDLALRPFDLSAEHPFRVFLIVLSATEHLLLIVMHHIASDGWSLGILAGELTELYQSRIEQRTASLPLLEMQYADYAVEERGNLHGAAIEHMLDYWREKLAGISSLDLRCDHSRPARQSTKGGAFYFDIDRALTLQLQSLSRHQGVTLFMTLLATFKTLLYRYTGQEDICIGTPIAGRIHPETAGTIGFFVNMLALRSEVSDELSFCEFLQQVKKTTLEAYERQEAPFEKVIEAVVKQRDPGRPPLFQVLFSLDNTPVLPGIRLGNTSIVQETTELALCQYELTISVREHAEGICCCSGFCLDLYDKDTVARMMEQYVYLLRSIVNDPAARLGELSLADPVAAQEITMQEGPSRLNVSEDTHVVDLFAAQVRDRPDHTAVEFENKRLTYKELDDRSFRLAHHLRRCGAVDEDIIPLCLERGMSMIIGILGIIRAGCAYLPIDPASPAKRIFSVISDSKATLAVSDLAHRSKLTAAELNRVVAIDQPLQDLPEEAALPVTLALAYVIYTSGSTGRPKGVMIGHRSLAAFISAQSRFFAIGPEDRILQFSNFCFDASVEQLFLALCNGASLILFRGGMQLDSKRFGQFLRDQRITHLHATPSFLDTVPAGNYTCLKRVVSGGEPCRKVLSEKWGAQAIFYNKYGPTETTVTVLEHKHCPGDAPGDEFLPIGRPLPGVSAYILDKKNRLLPAGICGELYIGGVQVARGYLGDPELTAQRFVPDPFSVEPGAIMYRTGDQVTRLRDGNIAFIGRADDQVKIRGYRVALGEVERCLLQSGLLKQCAVLAKENDGMKMLVAYIVPLGEGGKAGAAAWIKQRLPDYMIPSMIVVLDSLPLTLSGKIDRKMLPAPEFVEVPEKAYTAPRNELEQQMAAIWQRILGRDGIGINDNFFSMGGHSLNVMRLVQGIEQALGIEVPAALIFRLPTIRSIVGAIRMTFIAPAGVQEEQDEIRL